MRIRLPFYPNKLGINFNEGVSWTQPMIDALYKMVDEKLAGTPDRDNLATFHGSNVKERMDDSDWSSMNLVKLCGKLYNFDKENKTIELETVTFAKGREVEVLYQGGSPLYVSAAIVGDTKSGKMDTIDKLCYFIVMLDDTEKSKGFQTLAEEILNHKESK